MLSPVWAAVILAIALGLGAFLRSSSSFFDMISRPNGSRHPAIDGLRGYLAISVFLTHATSIRTWFETGVWDWPPSTFYHMAGTVPVSLFFMLTGFLFFGKLRQGRLTPLPFLRSRLLRLAPLYILAVVPFLLIVGERTGWEIGTDAGVLLLSIARWLALGLGGRPDVNGLPNTWVINTPVWTLWYEWIFYIVLPVLSLASSVAGTVFVGLVVAGLCQYTHSEYVVLNFVVGAFASQLVAIVPKMHLLSGRFAAAAALALLAIMAVVHRVDYGPWHTVLLTPLFVVVVYRNSIFGSLCIAPAKILGAISYSIYLLHCLVLQTAMQAVNSIVPIIDMGALEYWSIVGLVSAVVVLVSSVTFRLIEYPWMTSGGVRAAPL